jgi:peroxiredoxin
MELSGMKNKLAIAAFAVIAVLLVALGSQSILSQNNRAPNLTLVTLSGKPLSLNELHGKVVLVNFWATTCTTCVSEMPKMAETYKTFAPRGYEMVAVAMAYDRPDWVLNFTQQHALPFTVALDLKSEAEQAFGGVRLTPTSFLIDKQGRIVQRYLGAPDFARLNEKIESLLKQPA